MPLHQSLCIQTLTGSVLFGTCALTQGSLAQPMTRDLQLAWSGLSCLPRFWLVRSTTPAFGCFRCQGEHRHLPQPAGDHAVGMDVVFQTSDYREVCRVGRDAGRRVDDVKS